MIYFKYFLLFILGWFLSIVIGGILGAIFRSDKSKIGGFLSGIINPIITVFIILKFLVDKNQNDKFDILPIILILTPLTLFNLRALYNSGVQDGSGNDILPLTGVRMKINKGLIFGSLLGCLITLFLFTSYRF